MTTFNHTLDNQLQKYISMTVIKAKTSSARLSQSSERPRTDLTIWIRVFHSSFLVFCVFGLWVWVGVLFFFILGSFGFRLKGFGVLFLV